MLLRLMMSTRTPLHDIIVMYLVQNSPQHGVTFTFSFIFQILLKAKITPQGKSTPQAIVN